MDLTAKELGRKSLHMGMGLFALTLLYLNWWQAGLCALAAFLHNLFILPHTARFALREGRLDTGIVVYPLSVLYLILFFHSNLALAAAGWAYLAFGDGMATIVGKIVPLTSPRWAEGKSLGGLLAFALFGGCSANLFYNIIGEHSGIYPALLIIGFLLAILEVLPSPVNDNISIPVAASLLMVPLMPLSFSEWSFSISWLAISLAVNVVLASISMLLGLTSASGIAGGVPVGTLILFFGGIPAYALLFGFFLVASAATKLGYSRKSKLGIAQEGGGRRGSRHALANCSTAALLSLILPFSPAPLAVKIAIAAAFATALSDTLGSEIGQLYGKTPIHPLTFKKVPVGTEGAVSLEGSVAGLLGSLLLALLPLFWGWYPPVGAALVVAAALLGSMAESVLGVVGEWNNEILNFTNTVIGAASGYALALVIL